jgi:hypothetical protein
MESENDLFIEDYDLKTESIFRILLTFGVASIAFFALCFIYGFVYLLLNLMKLL